MAIFVEQGQFNCNLIEGHKRFEHDFGESGFWIVYAL